MFRVPFVNYKIQYQELKPELDKKIQDVFDRGDLILRQDVEEFEKNLADFLGVEYAIGLNSGTDALIFSLKAAGIKEGDEVITVSHTFFATIEAIIHNGAKPVLAEAGEDYLMDMDKAEALITKRTKAILPVHLNGRVCDMEKLLALAQKHNLVVIEDAAQALGAKFKGKKAGSFGLAGCFSFYPAKILGALGDAGAVATDNEEMAKKVRLFRNHGQMKNSEGRVEIISYGWTSRLDNLQAAILNVKFSRLQKWIEKRREIAELYYQGLVRVPEIKLPPKSDEDHFDIYQNFVIRAQKRDALSEFLKEKSVETLIKDPVALHQQPILKNFGFKLPFSEELAKAVISLPLYPQLAREQIEHVINCVKEFYTK